MQRQHVIDAAFNWQHIEDSRTSAIVTAEDLVERYYLLNAHLDGLQVAGNPGWQCALKELATFQASAEAFVCWTLALWQSNSTHLSALWALTYGHDESLWRGVVSAVALQPLDKFEAVVQRWLQSDDPTLQYVGLWACSVRRFSPVLPKGLGVYLTHDDARLRAIACKLAGRIRHPEWAHHASQLLADDKMRVKEQAAISQILMARTNAAEPLLGVLADYRAHAKTQRGLSAWLAAQRVELLARYLGHALPCGDERVEALVKHLTIREQLLFVAHHGDPSLLPLAVTALKEEAASRLAYWVLCFVTGREPYEDGLVLDEMNLPEPTDEAATQSDPDIGLHWPNPEAVAAWYQANKSAYPAGKPLLLGSTPSIKHCKSVLATGTQAARFAASIRLHQQDPTSTLIDTRAPLIAHPGEL